MPKEMIQKLWGHALLCAAYRRKHEVIPFLLDMGADLEYAESYDKHVPYTALGYAAMRG